MNEVWKSVIGYEGLYEVSNQGNVRSLNYLRTGKTRVLKPRDNGRGYLMVGLWKNKKRKSFNVHRLVAEAFIHNPNSEKFDQIDHINTIRTDNRVENLRWTDRSGNINNPLTLKKKSKIVLQYDLNGNFIREFPSTMEVQRVLGYFHQYISMCCNGNRKSAYGFIWKFITSNQNNVQ